MAKKKAHHFVPRYYLKGFAMPKRGGKIWVYPKNGDRPFLTGIGNVGVGNHYYSKLKPDGSKDSETIENYLAGEIEEPANQVIRKIRNLKPITHEEKRILSIYMVGMMTRVPRHRERVKEDVPRLIRQAREQINASVERWQHRNPTDLKRTQHLHEQMIDSLSGIEKDVIEDLSFPIFDENHIDILLSMNWALKLCDDSKFSFLTSDNPFCYTEAVGLLHEGSIFAFPISNKIAILGTWQPQKYKYLDLLYLPSNKGEVHTINRIVCREATRFVYYRSQANWISEMLTSLQMETE